MYKLNIDICFICTICLFINESWMIPFGQIVLNNSPTTLVWIFDSDLVFAFPSFVFGLKPLETS